MDSQSQLTEVTEHLFVGGVCAINDEIIQSLGTKRILIVNATKNLKDYSLTYDGVGDTKVEVVRVPVDDNVFSSLSPYFKVVADLIHENSLKSGKTIVHCMCGVSRSVSLCIAYLMTYKPSLKKIGQNMDLYEALDHIKARRPIASIGS